MGQSGCKEAERDGSHLKVLGRGEGRKEVGFSGQGSRQRTGWVPPEKAWSPNRIPGVCLFLTPSTPHNTRGIRS